MHPVAKEYVSAGETLPPDPAPDRINWDLRVHRIPGQRVYSVTSWSEAGHSFIIEHESAGSVHGDLLLVPCSSIVSFCDALFDEGLSVV